MAFVPSSYQQALLDRTANWARHFGTPECLPSVVVEATAGSGKSSTLEQMVRLLPSRYSVVVLAFNKRIAEAMKARMPRHVSCMTLNGLGHRAIMAWGQNRTGIRLDGYKVRNLVDQVVNRSKKALGSDIAKLVGLAKAHGMVPAGASKANPAGLAKSELAYVRLALMEDKEESWLGLMDRFDVTVPEEDLQATLDACSKVLLANFRGILQGTIDFDDQIYAPAVMEIPVPQYDFVAVDEVQDLNIVNRVIIERILKQNSRLIAIGDSKQAIYGWRGAASDSMARLREDLGCDSMPLSITYRCPTSHVALAKELVPQIEAAPWAEAGTVQEVSKLDAKTLRPEDGVICRRSAPLVELAYKLIAQRIRCRVLGRDIGRGLIALIDRMKARDMDELETKLAWYEARETERLSKRNEDVAIQSLVDKIETIRTIIGSVSPVSPAELIAEIQGIFASDDKDEAILTLCTVHKAKGLEWDRVYLLDRQDMPGRWARTPEAKQEEQNILYVAVTRSKKDLFFIRSGCLD